MGRNGGPTVATHLSRGISFLFVLNGVTPSPLATDQTIMTAALRFGRGMNPVSAGTQFLPFAAHFRLSTFGHSFISATAPIGACWRLPARCRRPNVRKQVGRVRQGHRTTDRLVTLLCGAGEGRYHLFMSRSSTAVRYQWRKGDPVHRPKRRADVRFRLLVLLCFILLVAVALYGRFGAFIASAITGAAVNAPSELGTWGDSFGAFNAAVSSLAFLGIIATLVLQERGLEETVSDQHRQRFDASFFELLRLQREARSELIFANTIEVEVARKNGKYTTFSPATMGNVPTSGTLTPIVAAVVEIHYRLVKKPGMKKVRLNDIVFAYMRYVHSVSESTIAPYYRLIYSILSRIREDPVLTYQEKARYGNLVRSQLSSDEILLLAINSLAPISADMKSLVTEFRMLKYLPRSSMRTMLGRFHDPAAFAGRDDVVPDSSPIPTAFDNDKYRSMIAALHAERLLSRKSRVKVEKKLQKQAGYVADYEEGRKELSVVEFVDVSRALDRHPAYFLRH